MNRRAYLSTLGVGGVVSLAGCAGIQAPGEGDEANQATMIVESGTNMEIYPHTPPGQRASGPPHRYNHVGVLNRDLDGPDRDFDVRLTGPDGKLFDGMVRLEASQADGGGGIVFFASKTGEYRCSVTVGDETISETWAVTEERLSRGGGMVVKYDGEFTTHGGVYVADS